MNSFCKKEVLISAANAEIQRCSCGIYHVALEQVTLHLSPVQFKTVAGIFKLALGIMTVQQKPDERVERILYPVKVNQEKHYE